MVLFTPLHVYAPGRRALEARRSGVFMANAMHEKTSNTAAGKDPG